MTSALRLRLQALRTATGGAAAEAATSDRQAAGAAAGAASGRAEIHVRSVALQEWTLTPESAARLMKNLGHLAREPALADLRPEDLLFLDLETTGLSLGAGTVAFLVGLARLVPSATGVDLSIEQGLMRALSHEREVLDLAAARLASCRALVTFNGKSYDMPLLDGRFVLARVPAIPRPPHFDALHPARRLLAHELPDVRLTTLERALWGRIREDDLPGAAVPGAFFAALRGDDSLLPDVLRHNADDLTTLARLPPVLAGLAEGEPSPSGRAADPLAVAALALARGERGAALGHVEACRAVAGSPRSLRRARLAARAGGPDAAREHWRRLCREPRAGVEPHERLAVILEHHDRDPAAALAVVLAARQLFAADEVVLARLDHRAARLERRLEGSGSLERGLPGRLPATSKEQERWRSSPWGTA